MVGKCRIFKENLRFHLDSNDLSDFMNGLNGKSVEESIEGAKEKLTADGMDSYLESVRSQWEEYRK